MKVNAYAAYETNSPLKPYDIERREVGPYDIQIDILYCGVCHSDLHSLRGEWGGAHFPLVPGHEIVGKITQCGKMVKRFQVGDLAGVGCMVSSCKTCPSCKEGLEQYCEQGFTATYGSLDLKSGNITQGGYSTSIVVDESFVLRIPLNIPLPQAAPLLCAGITTYSPLRRWKVKRGDRVAVVGLGGLGHMAVKLAAAMEAHVTVLSTSENKRSSAMKLGAHDFALTNNPKHLESLSESFDFILDTVSADHDYNVYLALLKRDATMVLLGLPEPQPVSAFSLVMKRRSLSGSLIGGIEETQEMLDFCSMHGISADVEIISMQEINEAYMRMLKGDVHYRFVIDLASLR